MAKKKVAELELKILGHLWKMNNQATVQEIIEKWDDKEKPGYTTILKKLQVMEKKELVRHEKFGKAYKYIPIISKNEISHSRLEELLKNVFSNNRIDFAHAFFDDKNLSIKDLQEIRKMIDKKEQEKNNGNT